MNVYKLMKQCQDFIFVEHTILGYLLCGFVLIICGAAIKDGLKNNNYPLFIMSWYVSAAVIFVGLTI